MLPNEGMNSRDIVPAEGKPWGKTIAFIVAVVIIFIIAAVVTNNYNPPTQPSDPAAPTDPTTTTTPSADPYLPPPVTMSRDQTTLKLYDLAQTLDTLQRELVALSGKLVTRKEVEDMISASRDSQRATGSRILPPPTSPQPTPQQLANQPIAREDPIVRVTFGKRASNGLTTVRISLRGMTARGQVRIMRPTTGVRSASWHNVQSIDTDPNGTTWGVLSQNLLSSGENVILHYTRTGPSDWAPINQSGFYQRGQSGDGLALRITPATRNVSVGTVP